MFEERERGDIEDDCEESFLGVMFSCEMLIRCETESDRGEGRSKRCLERGGVRYEKKKKVCADYNTFGGRITCQHEIEYG